MVYVVLFLATAISTITFIKIIALQLTVMFYQNFNKTNKTLTKT